MPPRKRAKKVAPAATAEAAPVPQQEQPKEEKPKLYVVRHTVPRTKPPTEVILPQYLQEPVTDILGWERILLNESPVSREEGGVSRTLKVADGIVSLEVAPQDADPVRYDIDPSTISVYRDDYLHQRYSARPVNNGHHTAALQAQVATELQTLASAVITQPAA